MYQAICDAEVAFGGKDDEIVFVQQLVGRPGHAVDLWERKAGFQF